MDYLGDISALNMLEEYCLFSFWFFVTVPIANLFLFIFLTYLDKKFNLFGWYGGKYTKKLIIVADAGTKPVVKQEVTETELLLLLHPELLELINKAETPELTLNRLKGIVNKESKIIQVEIHQSSMGSAKNWFDAFHVFMVLKTTSEIDGDYWWSLEKNTKHIVLQRSRNKDDVKYKLEGERRKPVKPYKEDLKGKGTIKDLFGMLLMNQVISDHYNIENSNCQSLVTFVSKEITEIRYEYDGWEFPSLPSSLKLMLYNRNVKQWQLINIVTGVSEWPLLFHLIFFENGATDFFDKVMLSGNYDINAVHGGYTPLHFTIMLKKTEMFKHLLEDPIKADPTTRGGQIRRNALHWAVINTMNTETIDLLLAHPKVQIDDVDENGATALHYAAWASDVIAVRKLLKKGANPNIGANEGLTPLHVAAYFGSETEIIDLILQAQKQNHIDDDKTENGATALHRAAASSNERMAQHLINKGADVNSRDNDGLTPLHVAALKAKDLRIIDLLLRNISDEDMNQYRNDVKLLSLAYRNKHLLGAKIAARLKRINRIQKPQSWVDKICKVSRHAIKNLGNFPIKDIKEDFMNRIRKPKSCADKILAVCVNRIILHYKFIWKPTTFLYTQLWGLGLSKAKNSQEIDTILEEKKFDINSRDQHGDTPLLGAIRANNVNTVLCLLYRGADPTKRNYDGFTPFQVAATREKNLDILNLLLATGKVDIDDGGKSGYTVLHWAVATSNVTAVDFLLSKRANPNVADQNGTTPLHVAAFCAIKTDVLGLILEKEVDINSREQNGDTPLSLAIRAKNVIGIKLLLEKGADPTVRNENSDTPIHLAAAAFNKNSAILDLLLANEKKIDFDERNNAGMTALHVALKESNVEAARFLLSKGANPHIADENGVTPLQLLKKVLKYFRQLQKKGAMEVMENQKFKLRRAEHNRLDFFYFSVHPW